MYKSLTFLLMVLVILSACNSGGKDGNDEQSKDDSIKSNEVTDTLHLFEEVAPPVAADELFDDFFFNFASDSRYQNQRITFPLSVKDGNETLKLTHDDWHQFNRFTAQDLYSVIYERESDLELQKDTSVSEVCVEWIDLKDEYIEQFNFQRISGKWMLTDITKEEMKDSPNGQFLKFYSSFVSDSTFQGERIARPLKFVLTSDDSSEPSETEELTVSDWFEMQSDMPVLKSNAIVNINYGQACISQNRKVVLMESIGSGLSMQFRFDKVNGEWRLVEIIN